MNLLQPWPCYTLKNIIFRNLQQEFSHPGTAEMSSGARAANNNKPPLPSTTNKTSYGGPTATEEARMAAKKVSSVHSILCKSGKSDNIRELRGDD